MPNQLGKLLKNAQGNSDNIIAVFIDVRGFSVWSKNRDSAAVANFVKHIYLEIIEKYFLGATFYKPTGDGLLVVISCTSNVKEAVKNTIETCQKIVDEFKNFCEDDPLITESVPDKVGIGVARGFACKLQSGEELVDYSGNILNLAARLMDMARPSGVVLDSSVIARMKSEELPELFRKNFSEDKGFLRGVSEIQPVTVHYNKRYTTVPDSFHIPIGSEWASSRETLTLAPLMEIFQANPSNVYSITLGGEPTDSSQIRISVERIETRAGRKFRVRQKFSEFYYEPTDSNYEVKLRLETLLPMLKDKLNLQDSFTIIARYPTKTSS